MSAEGKAGAERDYDWRSGPGIVRTGEQRPLLSFSQALDAKRGRHCLFFCREHAKALRDALTAVIDDL